MNRTQLYCFAAALAIALFVGSLIHGRELHGHYLLAHGRMIGEGLIATTNSTYVVQLGSSLKGRLEDLLQSPAVVESVTLGDNSVGDGTADACLTLANTHGLRVGIRIKQADLPKKFHVLRYGTISEAAASKK